MEIKRVKVLLKPGSDNSLHHRQDAYVLQRVRDVWTTQRPIWSRVYRKRISVGQDC